MKKRSSYFLAFMLVCLGFNAQALIYGAQQWRSAKGKKLAVLFDVHQDCADNNINNAQQQGILSCAQNNNAHVIVEDVLDQKKYDKRVWERLQQLNRFAQKVSPLQYLSNACRVRGISCNNVEYRFKRSLWRSGMFTIPASEIHAEITQCLNEIADYSDGQELATIYQEILQSYETDKKEAADSCAQTKDTDHTLAHILAHDYRLLDAKILHALHRTKHDCVVICVGGDHARNIAQYLPRLGYTISNEQVNDLPADCDAQQIDLSAALDVADFIDSQA